VKKWRGIPGNGECLVIGNEVVVAEQVVLHKRNRIKQQARFSSKIKHCWRNI